MASAQNPAPNADLFDSYFRRADLDRDGRISGLEAVTFFQASGLPKPVLAKIWDYADQNRIGFLGRAEFYNALKLVTVAQSKRELTPEIVKAALFGPAAAKIPPPQINLAALAQSNLASSPATQSNPSGPGPARVSAAAPLPSQSVGYRPQVPSGPNLHQQHLPNQESHLVRPPVIPQTMSASSSQPTQGIPIPGFSGAGAVRGPNSSNSGITGDGMAGRTVGPSVTISQVYSRGVGPLMSSGGFDLASAGPRAVLPPRPSAASGMMPPKPPVKDPKQLHVSGNGFAPGSNFGGDPFSATPSQPRQQSPTVSAPVSAAVSSAPGYQPPVRTNPLDSTRSSFSMQPGAGELQPTQGLPKQNQQVSATNPTVSPSVNSRIQGNSSQMPWPKMTQADVQKYSKVFVEVDKDKDGKITGGEARKLFLSWRLPIEVLKQVWDLSDQDNDSMLSHREFCIALYLMERYREGRPLPSVLPSNIILDFPASNQPAPGYSGGAWGPPHGFQQKPAMPVSSTAQTIPPARGRPPLPPGGPPADSDHANQKKSKVPVLEKNLVDQLSSEEQNSLNSRFKEAMEADKKVEELEKEIMESKEKIEFYRVKMQELVMYKSRCDNRLNEIMERVSGDKREVETLSKKYEDKYKQTGDVASKLTIEEATFRDIQEKKMELYRAIVGMEQGDDADFKARAEKIQSELDELVKSLNERCKSYGLRAKPITLLELPFAWQPGIQGTAADWDEDWDKFEDEGFTFVKELTLDVQNVIAPPKEKAPPPKVVEASKTKSPRAPTSPHADEKTDKPSSSDEQTVENGVHHDRNDAGTPKSAPGTPAARSTFGSPRDAQDSTFTKMSPDAPVSFDKEKSSDHEGAESEAWGMDNDDVDSVWGFNGPTSIRESNYRLDDDLLFGSGLSVRTGTSSPRGGGFQKRSTFDESVPSTPLNSGFSPSYKEVGSSSLFDSSSRFDSFNLHDTGVFPQRDLSRFDSMRSSKDFDTSSHGGFSQGPTFSRFDSMASSKDFDFGGHGGGFSQGPTLARFDSMASSKDFDLGGGGGNTLSRFDSMRSSADFDVGGHGFPSFDDSDPFGSTSFRPSLDGQPSRRASDSWGETPRQGGFDNAWGETPKHNSGFDSVFGETPKHSGGFDTAFGETPKHSGFDNAWGAETPRQGFNSWGETPRRASDSNWGETPRGGGGSSGFGNWGETPKRSSDNNWGETPKASFDNWGETPRKDAADKSWSAF